MALGTASWATPQVKIPTKFPKIDRSERTPRQAGGMSQRCDGAPREKTHVSPEFSVAQPQCRATTPALV